MKKEYSLAFSKGKCNSSPGDQGRNYVSYDQLKCDSSKELQERKEGNDHKAKQIALTINDLLDED